MTQEELDNHRKTIAGMSQIDMARLYRFAPCGHPYFSHDSPLCDEFSARFKELGGMTPEVSKYIGW